MRKIRVALIEAALFALVLTVPLAALAAAVGTAVDTVTGTDLITQALAVFSTWKGQGWLAGLLAATNLLTNFTKWQPIDDFLGTKWWLRPTISIVLGAALAVISGLTAGVAFPAALIAGVIAGLSSTGFHELYTSIFDAKTRTERAAGSALLSAVTAADTARLNTLKTTLDTAVAVGDPKLRIQALATWANANPPAPIAPAVK
jgi:hypothetical protein